MVAMTVEGPAVAVGRELTGPEGGPPRTRRVRQPVRLTRRGRVVVAGVAVLAAGALSVGLATAARADRAPAGTAAGGAAAPGRYVARVTVQPGQSLWTLAGVYDPGADPRDVVLQIQQLNSLPGAQLRAGETLWVPRAAEPR